MELSLRRKGNGRGDPLQARVGGPEWRGATGRGVALDFQGAHRLATKQHRVEKREGGRNLVHMWRGNKQGRGGGGASLATGHVVEGRVGAGWPLPAANHGYRFRERVKVVCQSVGVCRMGIGRSLALAGSQGGGHHVVLLGTCTMLGL